jgi:hypothetical protein
MKPESLALLPPEKRLIVAAGPARAGSTALFNIARLLLRQESGSLTSGWIYDLADPLRTTILVKVHRWEPDLAKRADVVLTCHRDLREVARSLSRMGRLRKGVEVFDQMAEVVYRHTNWKATAAVDIPYERIAYDLPSAVAQIALSLGISGAVVDFNAIASQVGEMRPPETLSENQAHDLETLLHVNHLSRKPIPSLDVENDIHLRFLTWQRSHGYV